MMPAPRSRARLPARAGVLCLVVSAALAMPVARAEPRQPDRHERGPAAKPALRHMQIYRIKELGLELWVENQPPWEAQLSQATGRPTFVAESPQSYHPPTVMTYMSFQKEKVPAGDLRDTASAAIRRASQNFGLSADWSYGIPIREAHYGVLDGYEGTFEGKADGTVVDVLVFVGQAPGKFPVAFSVYTVRGKMSSLSEQIRRAWTNVKYLSP